jgi:hypothetical protein
MEIPGLNDTPTLIQSHGPHEGAIAPLARPALWLMVAVAAMLVISVTARLVISWRHFGDLDSASGVWTALAIDIVDDGTLYRPMISPLGYGGSRYAPLHPVLQAGLMRLGMAPIASGYLLSFVATVAIIAALYKLMRLMGASVSVAASMACLVLCANCFREGIAEIRGDPLALALNLWGLVVIVKVAHRTETAGSWPLVSLAAVLFALSLATKFTNIFGIATAVLWLSLRGQRGKALRLAAVWVIAVALFVRATQWGSGGRALAIFKATAAGGGGIGALLHGPGKFKDNLLHNDRAVFCFLIIAVLILMFERSWKSLPAILLIVTITGTMAIFGSPGTSINHLLDLQAACILVIGARLMRGGLIRFAVVAASLILAFMSILACRRQITAMRVEDNRQRLEAVLDDVRQSSVVGPIYAYDTLIPILANQRPYMLDAFMARALRIKDPIAATRLWDDLAHTRFSAFITRPYRPYWNEPTYQTDEETLHSHLDHYYLKSEHGSDQVYLPKPQ